MLVEPHWACARDEPTHAVWGALETALNANQPAILLTHMPSPSQPAVPSQTHLLLRPDGSTIGDWGALTADAVKAGLAAYQDRRSQLVTIAGQSVFAHVFVRRDQLLIIGAGHISIPLVGFAQALDFCTAVIDPRQVFATPERFPVVPDQLLAQWPQAALKDWDLHDDTYTVVLTHDPKIDDEALHFFLRAPVSYIGALGSRKSHAKRCARLLEAGFNEADMARIKGPAGLDIGSQTPAEIALSIMAEVVATKRSR